MLHEARDRQKFLSDAQHLRDMQHKVESEYQEVSKSNPSPSLTQNDGKTTTLFFLQACLRRQEYRRDSNEKKRDQFGGQEANADRSRFSSRSSSRQSSGEGDPLAEPRLSIKNSAVQCDSILPAIDRTAVKQKHKSTMTPKKPEKVGPSKPSPGARGERPLFCVGYSPYCSVFAFSPAPQPGANSCCLVLPLVPPAAPKAPAPHPRLPPGLLPALGSPAPSPEPPPAYPAALCYFPVSCPSPAQTPVLCLPGPRRPTPPPQILSRKRRPGLGRMTISPDMQGPRAAGDRSRQKSQLPVKSPALRGPDPVQREGPTWASDTKLKRPTLERRNLAPASQPMTMTETTPERARKGDPRAPSQNEPHPALSPVFPATNSPRALSVSLGPPLFTTTMGGSRRVPFRFRDEDFYSVLSLSHEGENDDTEEETHIEEELLLVGMHPLHSSSNHKRSPFLGTSATQAKNKNLKENPENCRANSVRRSESSYGSPRKSNVTEPVREELSVRQRMFQDPRLPDGGSAEENDSGDSENEKKTFRSRDTKLEPNLDDDLGAENVLSDCTSMEDRPGAHDFEREWRSYLNNSSTSLDCFISGRPTAPRSSMNSSCNTPGSLMPSAPREDIPVDLPMASTSVHSSDSEGNARFNVHQPLSPIRNRNPFASAENHSYFPVNSAHEFDVRGAEAITLTSQPQGPPLYTEDLLLNPQSSLVVVEPSSSSRSRMNSQGHLRVPGSLQENIPFTFFAVSDFPNQSGRGNRRAVSGSTDEAAATKIKADPEKLKKLQESILEEDSEEEGDLCRICQIAGGSPTNPLLEPCGCVGSLQFVHQECLKKWLKVKITSGANLGAVKTCEMCKQGLLVDLDDFNVTDFYRKHQQSRVQNELMNSGLYLVLLLHLYEQRFAELMRLNYSRVSRDRGPGQEKGIPGVMLKKSVSTKGTREPSLLPEMMSLAILLKETDSELGDGNENTYESNSRVI